MHSKVRLLVLLTPLVAIACGGSEPRRLPDAGLGAPDAEVATPDAGSAATDAGFALDAGELDAGPPPPSFEHDVAPILRVQCQGCHFVTDLPPQLFLEGAHVRATYERLVSQPAVGAGLDYVAPGDPDQSYLLRKVVGTHRAVGGVGDHMPPPAARRRVPAADVATLQAWIEAGAAF